LKFSPTKTVITIKIEAKTDSTETNCKSLLHKNTKILRLGFAKSRMYDEKIGIGGWG
jgi:hypothetical protein